MFLPGLNSTEQHQLTWKSLEPAQSNEQYYNNLFLALKAQANIMMYIVTGSGDFVCQAVYLGRFQFIAHTKLGSKANAVAVFGGADSSTRVIRKRYGSVQRLGHLSIYTLDPPENGSTTMFKQYMPYNKIKG